MTLAPLLGDYLLATLNRLDLEDPDRPWKVLQVTRDRDGLETDEMVDSFDDEDAAICEAEIRNDSDAYTSFLGAGDSVRFLVVHQPEVQP